MMSTWASLRVSPPKISPASHHPTPVPSTTPQPGNDPQRTDNHLMTKQSFLGQTSYGLSSVETLEHVPAVASGVMEAPYFQQLPGSGLTWRKLQGSG